QVVVSNALRALSTARRASPTEASAASPSGSPLVGAVGGYGRFPPAGGGAPPTEASAASPSGSPVVGSMVGYVRFPSAGTSSPPTSSRSSCHIPGNYILRIGEANAVGVLLTRLRAVPEVVVQLDPE